MSLAVSKPLDEILEREWDSMLFKGGKDPGLAPLLGWTLSYHTLRSKGSRAGFPDRVLVRERAIISELKREKRVATPLTGEQSRWLDALTRGGIECYLWRPSDLDEVARILSKRWRYVAGSDDYPPYLLDANDPWTPGSLWVPGRGRADGS